MNPPPPPASNPIEVTHKLYKNYETIFGHYARFPKKDLNFLRLWHRVFSNSRMVVPHVGGINRKETFKEKNIWQKFPSRKM